MSWHSLSSTVFGLPHLLAQAAADVGASSSTDSSAAENVRWWYTMLKDLGWEDWATGIVIAVVLLLGVVLPFAIGILASRMVRMREYGMKLGMIFVTLAMSAVVIAAGWPPKLGIDLQGGVILMYEVSQETIQEDNEGEPNDNLNGEPDFDIQALVEALKLRINPGGVKEVVVRPNGTDQVEIIIPEVNQTEVENIKKVISTAGFLRFRIVADPIKHAYIIDLAREQEDATEVFEETVEDGKTVRKQVGYWARVGRDEKEVGPGGIHKLKVNVARDTIRDATTKTWLTVPPTVDLSVDYAFEQWLKSQGITDVEVLMATDDGLDLVGGDLASVRIGTDNTLNPMVEFEMKPEGAIKMSTLTSENLKQPDGRQFRLGIILDNALLSAPVIQSTIADRGQITGNFTKPEVEFLVNILRAGKLPAALNKTPISTDQIDPLLGVATIKQGAWAIGISLAVVLVFMVFYYRFSGLVADMALMANLLLIFGVMMLVKAAFTLPGLAGLVLTVGMSVDANVLIFERIREELNRGSALRMAIRNGFSRATTTIVDANLTTLITAIVLYAIGTDQIRGFAVTLILGIVMSMYTAIFCSRAFFDIGERKRWFTKLGMASIVGSTHVDFVGKRKLAVGASIALIVIGLVAVGMRGRTIFDIDFNGGSSVHATFIKPISDSDIRAKLDKTFSSEPWSEIQKQLDERALAELNALDNDGLSKVAEQLKLSSLTLDSLAQMKPEDRLDLAIQYRYGEGFERPKGKQDYSVYAVTREGQAHGTVYQIDCSILNAEYFKEALAIAFQENGKSLLESYTMSYQPLVATVIAPPKATNTPSEFNLGSPPGGEPTPPTSDPTKTDGAPPSGTPGPTPPSSPETPDAGKPADPAGKGDAPKPSGGDFKLPGGDDAPSPSPSPEKASPETTSPEKSGPEKASPENTSPENTSPEKTDGEAKSDDTSFAPLLTNGERFVALADDDAAPAPAGEDDKPAAEEKPAAGEKPDAEPETPAKAPADENKSTDAGPADPAKPQEPAASDPAQEKPPAGEPGKTEPPSAEPPATTNPPPTSTPPVTTPETSTPETTPPSTTPPSTTPPSTAPPSTTETPPVEPAPPKVETNTTLEFAQHPIDYLALNTKIVDVGNNLLGIQLNPKLQPRGEGDADWNTSSKLQFKTWEVTVDLDEPQAKQVFDKIQNDFSSTTVWTSSRDIGSQVAGDFQRYAIMALLVSLLGIIGYIWWRFQKVMYGLAAVVALVHDVLITLGAIAMSAYVASYLGFLQIEEFKISLPVVAALLTIIGYSLNDTIVVFDRIREVRGKSPQLTGDMINTSINQTLSRTLLTSLTTLLVVVVLYFLGGSGIHTFAFCLVVGVIVGTYSSIFIASPFLLWMTGAKIAPAGSEKPA